MNYVNHVYELLEEEFHMKGTKYVGLLEVYGLLVMTVGVACTKEHIHDAWSIWQNKIDPSHKSLKPFDELSKDVQELDESYRQTVIRVAYKLLVEKMTNNIVKGMNK